jgi:putative Mg2+ transporter-C (MgtC) family protein
MAGLRTHIMVSLASCLVQILSVHGYADVVGATASRDPARLAAQGTPPLHLENTERFLI